MLADVRGRPIQLDQNTIFYCFIIADIGGKLSDWTFSWQRTADGRGRLYQPDHGFKGSIEVIGWDIPPEDWVANSRIGGRSTSPSRIIRLAHDHMASDIALNIEIGARNAGASFNSHIDILQAAPVVARSEKKPLKIPVEVNGVRTFVEPDALFAIGRRNYALEADKGTESIKAVIVPKIFAYREIVASGIIDDYLGIDNLTVLFATTNPTRMKNIMEELARIARNGRSTMFAFRAEAQFGDFLKTPPPSGRLFTGRWHRVGHDDLVLAN